MQTLVLDSDRARVHTICEILRFLDHEVAAPTDVSKWRDVITERNPQCVIIVALRSDTGTRALFRSLKEFDPHMAIVLFTGKNEQAVTDREVTQGVVSQVSLPLRSQSATRALEAVDMYRAGRHQGSATRSSELFRSLVGSSEGVRGVRQMIEQVADTDATVLLLGESGTGKEVVARNLHYHSKRRYKPFVPLNCAAVAKDLLESELFGHEKGAFTGAIGARMGRFEMADGGTLFLDEIGDMPADMQVKLLRVLQDHTFERVGSNKSLKADVRIIAATNADLEKSIAEGRFRQDLYFRLNVFPIDLPPLRDRVDDLPLLINDLITRMQNEQRGSVSLSPAAMYSLGGYNWPGNVRELANLIERLVILYPNAEVDIQDLPEKYQTNGADTVTAASGWQELPQLASRSLPREGFDLKEHMNSYEKMLIEQALDEVDGVVAHAAKRLGMGRTTLVEKMRKFGLHKERAVEEPHACAVDEPHAFKKIPERNPKENV